MHDPAVRQEAQRWRVDGLSCRLICLGLCLAVWGNAGWAAQTKKKPASTSTKSPEVTPATSATSKVVRKPSRKKAVRDKYSVEGIADFATTHFLVHTDLSDDEAEELLDRLETMLDLISKYWGRNLSGVIEMFVVKDLSKWPTGAIPDEGLKGIRDGAGLTVTRSRQTADSFLAKSVVYAIADRGTPQHEVVHAYCSQTFGRTGPLWYSEGMAEMGQYWRTNDKSVNAHPGVIRYLRTSEPKSLREIVYAKEYTGDSWQNYAWRWALCHLMATNTNYQSRFHALGMALLTNQPDASFEEAFGSMAKEISFEYRQFLKQVDTGYRADLCSWDWKTKSKLAKSASVIESKIDSARGWQPSKLILSEGEEYEYSVTGTWVTHDGATPVDADGDRRGRGRLIGAVLSEIHGDYVLSDPFPLGKFGSFKATGAGTLVLRCNDDWSSLADNHDCVKVKIKLKNKGQPLPPPKESEEKKKAEKLAAEIPANDSGAREKSVSIKKSKDRDSGN